jgi:hypothetical protein
LELTSGPPAFGHLRPWWSRGPRVQAHRVPLVVEMMATAIAPSGARFTRRAVVRIGAFTRGNPSPLRILAWE